MAINIYVCIFAFLANCWFFDCKSIRSVHRIPDQTVPEIITYWSDQENSKNFVAYNLKHNSFEPIIFSRFDKEYFYNHLLPTGSINYRYEPEKNVEGKELDRLINKVIDEINQRKHKFTDFKILKKRDFNFKKRCGVLILKFKKYPFVVKLFIESPESFVQPFSKGIEPSFFFVMGGGAGRYLAGFTRVKNLEVIKTKVQVSPYWSSKIDMPRKWFWIPKDLRWMTVLGKNLGPNRQMTMTLPSMYATVSDWIIEEDIAPMSGFQKRKTVIALCKYLENRMDLHIDNFMQEKGTGKLVIIDSEHFPSMVGLKNPLEYDSYFTWYRKLVGKCISDSFLKTKRQRIKNQYQDNDKNEFLRV